LPGNLALGELLREWNDLTAAKERVQQSLKHGEMDGNPRVLVQSYVTLARILQAQGDSSGALKAIHTAAQLEQHYQISQLWDLPSVAAHLAWLRLKQGDLAAAVRWAEEQGLKAAGDITFAHEVDYLVLARLLIAQGRAKAAIELLERLRQAAETGGRTSRVIEAQLLLALAFQAQGDTPTALTTLNRALTLAEPAGYVRLFVDESLPMSELLQIISQQLSTVSNQPSTMVSQTYVAKLLAAFPGLRLDLTEQSQIINRKSKIVNLIEPLTDRELAILQLIIEGLSNAEIARKLFLTVGTVKLHAHHIYGKLGVSNRTQAVVKARALGLLAPR
jgi:LuxR family transcriptional regulator, maltose regulon positive regulatory protein